MRRGKGYIWRKNERVLLEAHLRLDAKDGSRAVEFTVVLTSRHAVLSREVNYRDGKAVKTTPWIYRGQSRGWGDHKGKFTRYWRGRKYTVVDVGRQTKKLVREMEQIAKDSRARRVV